ncbi:hypothetical protein [Polyangium sp. y55x31]|uniref:hypothetical protein n=1 Tax=Polyangium sp. y55x31 TaxID=3042688 RepID=UPI00248216D6|nr:hypothetical protein [Polyangium sp. y55x31]
MVALLANLDDIRNSKEVKDHWWLMPVALVAIGYMLRKRRNAHANAVIAVGGAMFALAYTAQQKAAAAQKQAPAGPQQAVFRADDTAAPVGMLPLGPQSGFWLQTPDGRFVRLPHISRRMQATRQNLA